MEKQAYSVAEAATTLGISRTTLYELIQAGVISTFSIGSKKLISAQTLEDFDDFFYRGGGYEVCDD
jgi:excisionase family DNA binding protein